MYVNYEENFKDGKNGEYSDEDAAGPKKRKKNKDKDGNAISIQVQGDN